MKEKKPTFLSKTENRVKSKADTVNGQVVGHCNFFVVLLNE